MNVVEGLAWAVVYMGAVLAPFALGGALIDARFRRRVIRQWHHGAHERRRHPRGPA